MSLCTVAGGSSGNEILFPCQIKASAPISVTVKLGACSHKPLACRRGDGDMRLGRKEGRKEGGDNQPASGVLRERD